MDFDVPDESGPDARISLSYDDFLEAIARMREVDFPIEREPEEAWPDFVGWRVNYEPAAFAVAAAVDAVPALWSGPRRRHKTPIPPMRPPGGRPPTATPAAGRQTSPTSTSSSRPSGKMTPKE